MTMWTKQEEGNLPQVWSCGDSEHEAASIVGDIVKYQSEGKHLADIAILYRSNTQVPVLEDQLRLNQVPYQVFGGQKLYERKEVKDLIAYLCTLSNPQDEISLRRILNTPHRGIGRGTLEKLVAVSRQENVSLFEVMSTKPEVAEKKQTQVQEFANLINKHQNNFKNLPLAEATQTLIEEIKYLEHIEKILRHGQTSKKKKRRYPSFSRECSTFFSKF